MNSSPEPAEDEQLIKKLEEVQASHQNEIRQLEQQVKAATFSKETAEIKQAEGEITFNQYKKQSDRRINELINEIENLKVEVNSKTVDLNISRMPIKTEPKSYELAELKSDLDQLTLIDDNNKKIIKDLELKLAAIEEEKNLLQTEHGDMSTQIMEYIEEVDQLKSNLATLKTGNLTESNSMKEQLIQLKENNAFLSNKLALLEPLKAKNDILASSVEKVEAENVKLVQQLAEIVEKYDSLKQSQTRNDEAAAVALAEMTASYSSAKQTIVELEDEVGKLKTRIEEDSFSFKMPDLLTDTERDKLQNSYMDLESKYVHLQKSYETDTEKLQSIIDEKLLDIGKTEEECKTIKSLLLESYDKIKISMEEAESLNAKNLLLSKDNLKLTNLTETQTAELLHKTKTIEELQQRNVNLCDESDKNLKDELQKLREKHRAEIAEKVDELKQSTQQFQSSIQQLEFEITDKVNELKQSTQQFQSSIQQLESDVTEKENELKQSTDRFQSKIQLLESEKQQLLNKTSDVFQNSIAELKSKLQEKEQFTDDLRADISKLNTDLDLKKQQLDGSQTEISSLKLEILRGKQQADGFLTEISTLKAELCDKEKHLNGCEAEFLKLKTDLDLKHQQSGDFQTEMSTLKSDLRASQQQSNYLETEISKLKAQLGLMEQQSVGFLTEISTLKADLCDKEKQLNDCKAEFLKLKTDVDLKQQQTGDFQTEVSTLKSDLRASQQQSKHLETEVSKLKAALDLKKQQAVGSMAKIATLKLDQQQQLDKFHAEISKITSDLNEKEKSLQTANNLAARLENQLR